MINFEPRPDTSAPPPPGGWTAAAISSDWTISSTRSEVRRRLADELERQGGKIIRAEPLLAKTGGAWKTWLLSPFAPHARQSDLPCLAEIAIEESSFAVIVHAAVSDRWPLGRRPNSFVEAFSLRCGFMLDALESATSGSAGQAYERALELGEDQRWEEAIVLFSEAIKLDPNYSSAYGSRGRASAATEDLEQAIVDFDRFIELIPNSVVGYVDRGAAHSQLEQFHRAIDDFGKAIDLDPKAASAHRGRALAYAARAHLQAGRGVQEDVERSLTDLDKVELLEAIDRGYSGTVPFNDMVAPSQALRPRYLRRGDSWGVAYTRLGNPEQAVAGLTKVLSTASDPQVIDQLPQLIEKLRSQEAFITDARASRP